MNCLPYSIFWNADIPFTIAINSCCIAGYLVSAFLKALEKYATGSKFSPCFYNKTALMAKEEASVFR